MPKGLGRDVVLIKIKTLNLMPVMFKYNVIEGT